MKIGLQIPRFTWPGGDAAIARTLADIAQTADGVGFSRSISMKSLFSLISTFRVIRVLLVAIF